MEGARDIYERAVEYALRVIRVYRFLQKTKDSVAVVLGRQLLRSGSSIGANLTEARSGESRKDFVHKFSIAQKEARESLYWPTLIQRAELVPDQKIGSLIQETNELIAIITSIIVKTKGTNS